jgi:hypothetical protein
MICQVCDIIEEEHPEFNHARNAEAEEVMKGNTNFDGVGLPHNYQAWADGLLVEYLHIEGTVKELYERLTMEE